MTADAHLNMDALRKADLKRAMGSFATGVTIVATRFGGADHAMTCNSFNTVSLDPPMVLWSIRKQSHSLDAFLNGGGYSVSVLGTHQRAIASRFTTGDPTMRLESVETAILSSGRKRLADNQAWFDCTLQQAVEAGDHFILIGRIVAYASDASAPLIYVNGDYANATDKDASGPGRTSAMDNRRG